MTNKSYYLYALECFDSTIYCGITTDVERRLAEHNEGRRGAKYTRSRRPVRLLASWYACCRSCALKIEIRAKRLSRKEKIEMVKNQEIFERLCKPNNSCLLLIHEVPDATRQQREIEKNVEQ